MMTHRPQAHPEQSPDLTDRIPPEMSRRKLKGVDLPTEVWAKIAAQMSLWDWARASGTCRSTRAVCVKNLTIKRHPAAGVQWASRMLDLAEALCLTAQPLRQIAQAVAPGLHSIKQLQQLVIFAPPFSTPALSCLPWLLAQACKLEVLVTPAGSRPWFPPLATLKHLQLKFHRDAGNFCDVVRNCTALETLSLHSEGTSRSRLLGMGKLEMDGLPHLRVFVMKAIAPRSIQVPQACQLHIDVSADTDMQDSMWQDVLANIHSINADRPQQDAASLDLFLNRAVNPLQNLQILHMEVFPAHRYLNLRAFARMKQLRISGRDLDLFLPAGVSWDALELDATGKLELDIEDLNGFPRAVPRFAARFGLLCSTQLLELCTLLGLDGIKCIFLRKRQCKSIFWYPMGHRPFGCCYGACLDCLVASGQAVGPNMHHMRDPLHDIFDIDMFGGDVGTLEDEMLDDYEDDDDDFSDEDD
ncbi:hypothetical protein COCOBI_07-1440 [Coccomyxa sp. Obi]|nr:hypothetical protein COCOBI_07-1440 [Coccomyxa sp. Obi]